MGILGLLRENYSFIVEKVSERVRNCKESGLKKIMCNNHNNEIL